MKDILLKIVGSLIGFCGPLLVLATIIFFIVMRACN